MNLCAFFVLVRQGHSWAIRTLTSLQSQFAKQQHFPTVGVGTAPNCKQHQISSICDFFYMFSWGLQ